MADTVASDEAAQREDQSGRLVSKILTLTSSDGTATANFKTPDEKSFRQSMQTFMNNLEIEAEHHPDSQDPVVKFVTMRRFEVFITCAILANAVQMGITVQMTASGFTPQAFDTTTFVLEHIFTAIFAVEMCLKIYAFRLAYFMDGWNLMDFCLVSVSIVDNWFLMFFATDDLDNLTVLRLVRLFRVFRMIKVVKVKRELLVLVEGIVASIRAMVPIMTLLGLVVYAFSILCVEIIGKENSKYTDLVYLEEQGLLGKAGLPWDNQGYFGALPQAWLTLFNIAVLSEWPEIIRPVFLIQGFFVPILMCFVMVTAFGIINVIIGVIVEQTEETARQSLLASVEHEKQMQMKNIADMARLICELDCDHDGLVSPAEFKSPEMMQLFQGIKLPQGFDSDELYIMLDRDGSGEVTIDEFMMGMYRIIYCNDFQRACLSQMHINMVKKFIVEHRASTRLAFKHAEEHISKEVSVLREDLSRQIAEAVSHVISAVGAPVESTASKPQAPSLVASRASAEEAIPPAQPSGWVPAPEVGTSAAASQSFLRRTEAPATPRDPSSNSLLAPSPDASGREAPEPGPASPSLSVWRPGPPGKSRTTGPPLYYPGPAIAEEQAALAPVGLPGSSQLAHRQENSQDNSRPLYANSSLRDSASASIASF